MSLFVRLLINAAIVYVLAWVLPGIDVASFWSAIIVALVLGVLNVFLKPLLIILTIPVTIVTMGLFLLVINAFIILMADSFIDGFVVNGFWWALLFSILMSLFNTAFMGGDKEPRRN